MKPTLSITHAPKVALATLLADSRNLYHAALLHGIHRALVQLHGEAWIPKDAYAILLAVWREATDTDFHDTLPTYSVVVDGERLDGDIVESLLRVQASLPPDVADELARDVMMLCKDVDLDS
jgi:hypothetical protein